MEATLVVPDQLEIFELTVLPYQQCPYMCLSLPMELHGTQGANINMMNLVYFLVGFPILTEGILVKFQFS